MMIMKVMMILTFRRTWRRVSKHVKASNGKEIYQKFEKKPNVLHWIRNSK